MRHVIWHKIGHNIWHDIWDDIQNYIKHDIWHVFWQYNLTLHSTLHLTRHLTWYRCHYIEPDMTFDPTLDTSIFIYLHSSWHLNLNTIQFDNLFVTIDCVTTSPATHVMMRMATLRTLSSVMIPSSSHGLPPWPLLSTGTKESKCTNKKNNNLLLSNSEFTKQIWYQNCFIE